MPVSDSSGEVGVGILVLLLASCVRQGTACHQSRAAQRPQFYVGLSEVLYIVEREAFRRCRGLNKCHWPT
jgi:hypothetical protein